jgi:hypothetical protein
MNRQISEARHRGGVQVELIFKPVWFLSQGRRTVLVALAALSAAACGGDDDGGGARADAGPHPDGAGEIDAGPDLPDGPGLAGFLREAGGDLIPHQQVLACMATTCLFGETDEHGFFHFEIEPTEDVALKTTGDPDTTPRRAAALCPIDIADAELVYVPTLYIPLLPDGVLFGPEADDPQTLEPGDGLVITLNRADLTPRVGDALVDAAARAVPPEQRCPQLVVPDEEVLAVYALHPFACTSSSPMAVRAPSELPAGTEVHFRTISEIDGELSAPVVGHADGSQVATDPDLGILELTWLVISR